MNRSEKVARALFDVNPNRNKALRWEHAACPRKRYLAQADAALDASCHEELVTALRPFAEYGEHMHRLHDSMVITQGSSMARRQLTGGDCKAAFALLAKVEASDA